MSRKVVVVLLSALVTTANAGAAIPPFEEGVRQPLDADTVDGKTVEKGLGIGDALLIVLGSTSSLSGGLSLSVRDSAVVLSDAGGELATYSGVSLADASGKRKPFGWCDFERTGPSSWRARAKPPANWIGEVPTVSSTFGMTRGCLRVGVRVTDWKGKGAPNAHFLRCHPKGFANVRPVVRTARWVRPEVGVPYEVSAGHIWTVGDGRRGLAYIQVPTEEGVNARSDWQSPQSQHFVFRKAGPNAWEGGSDIWSLASGADDERMAGVRSDATLAVAIETGRAYNCFTNAAAPVAFDVCVRSLTETGVVRRTALRVVVRDFDGRVVCSADRDEACAPLVRRRLPFSFRPETARGLYFAEAELSDPTNGERVFTRTTFAVLPPHEYVCTDPEKSVFGLSDYWPYPSEKDVLDLMDRLGVRWTRLPTTPTVRPGRRTMYHSGNRQFRANLTGAEREKWICGELEKCVRLNAACWEFGNELNMSSGTEQKTSNGIGCAVHAPKYAEWVREICRVRREMGLEGRVRLASCGLAGFDRVFCDRLRELGVWELLDDVCLHPGSGGKTPDFPFVAPERDERLPTQEYWNYFGTVRNCQAYLAEHGKKPLWLTETYARTNPNRRRRESLRTSASSVVLNYALGLAAGVRCVQHYMLFDTGWYDPLGAQPFNHEFFGGLLSRDQSFKPSAMAYAAIAEALDGATFAGWMTPSAPNAHGLRFATPQGETWVLWDRSEGYDNGTSPTTGVSTEPWVPTWTKATEVRLAADGPVEVSDEIGRARTVMPTDGFVTLALTGAPTIVRVRGKGTRGDRPQGR